MKDRDLKMLEHLARLEYQARQRAAQALAAQEARLRLALARIDAARREDTAVDEDLARQRIGADLAWQALQDNRGRALQIELARVMAQREPVLEALRRSFGREQVVRALADQALSDRQKLRDRTAEP